MDNPIGHVTWWGVVARVWYLPFAGMAPCLCVCESYDFAECCGSLVMVFYEPLQMSCSSCCKSMQILVDGSWSFSICFSESLQIHADLCRSICRDATIWVPTLPSVSDVSNLFGKYGGSGEYSSTDLVQCDSASWQLLAGVVPAHGVAMDTSLPWSEVLRPLANIQSSSSQAHLLAMSLTISLLIIYK